MNVGPLPAARSIEHIASTPPPLRDDAEGFRNHLQDHRRQDTRPVAEERQKADPTDNSSRDQPPESAEKKTVDAPEDHDSADLDDTDHAETEIAGDRNDGPDEQDSEGAEQGIPVASVEAAVLTLSASDQELTASPQSDVVVASSEVAADELPATATEENKTLSIASLADESLPGTTATADSDGLDEHRRATVDGSPVPDAETAEFQPAIPEGPSAASAGESGENARQTVGISVTGQQGEDSQNPREERSSNTPPVPSAATHFETDFDFELPAGHSREATNAPGDETLRADGSRENRPASSSPAPPEGLGQLNARPRLAINSFRTTEESHAPPSGPQIDPARFVSRVTRAFETAITRGGPILLRLSPPELGSVRLELTIKDGAILATLETETAAARTALLDNLPALRERLSGQDLRVEQFDVNVQDESGRNRQAEGELGKRDGFENPPHPDGSATETEREGSIAELSRAQPTILSTDQLNIIV